MPILLFGLVAGDYVPAFELGQFDGDDRTLSYDIFKNDISVVIFWSTYCDECVEAFETVSAKQAEFRRIGVDIVTINRNE